MGLPVVLTQAALSAHELLVLQSRLPSQLNGSCLCRAGCSLSLTVPVFAERTAVSAHGLLSLLCREDLTTRLAVLEERLAESRAEQGQLHTYKQVSRALHQAAACNAIPLEECKRRGSH